MHPILLHPLMSHLKRPSPGGRNFITSLIEEMSPEAFERLTQRMLRESGFVHVEVTGRTGDGGIDGKGIARINGLMSFHIAFQCKNTKALWVHRK